MKKAEMGIGTLIIFIAMILVAAIAAAVLIQTATSLQNKALLTGKRTQGQVSTAISPLLVFGEDGTTGNITTLYMKIKLAPGADAIKFSDSLIEVDLQDASADLTFNRSDGTCANGEFATDSNGDGNFSVKYLIQGSEWRNEYLHRGDVAMVCFASPRGITPDEDLSVRLVPKVGTSMTVETAVPDIINQKRVYIFP